MNVQFYSIMRAAAGLVGEEGLATAMQRRGGARRLEGSCAEVPADLAAHDNCRSGLVTRAEVCRGLLEEN